MFESWCLSPWLRCPFSRGGVYLFSHLRVASSFSRRYGTATPTALVARAADAGQGMAALTDRDGVWGAAEHVRACESAGLRPVLGVDLALATPEGGRVVVLARGRSGWAGVCRLVTAAHRGPGPVAVTPEQVVEHSEGAVVLLGPDSDVGRALAQERPGRARELLAVWLATGAQTVLAPHDHGAPGQRLLARSMVRLADRERLLAVLTNAVRYTAARDAEVAWALDRVRAHSPGGRSPEPRTAHAHLATGADMLETAVGVCAGDTARARRLLAHTTALATSCALNPVADLGWGRLHLPDRPRARAELRSRVAQGAARRGLDHGRRARAARDRAAQELAVIDRMGLWEYFLTVADAAAAIRDKGIRCSARGSAVGSLVVHLLGISSIDPVESGLLFERFLTPSRPGQPDVDLDVESARRLEAYDAVLASHAGASAAVGMLETYRARSALRDAGLALSLPAVEVERISRVFPRVRASRIGETARDLPELRRLEGLDSAHVRRLFRLAERLDGLPQHVAMHPCGLVLSSEDMAARVPTQPSQAGYPVTQADKHDVEEWGLLKLDVLGVRMQSALAHAHTEIIRTTGTELDLEALPDDDEGTAHLMAGSHTLGCFQIESPGQRELVSRLRPRTRDDLVADISLFRPGPMGVDMVSVYLAGRQGAVLPVPHPSLEPVLAPTGGALLWHEQLLLALDAITGCGLDRAEAMRRALGSEEGRAQVESEFRSLAGGRGHTPGVVDRVWSMVAAFGNFGFCRAHGAAFAEPTYQSAYLKAHFPAALFAGVMTHDPGMYPRRALLHDARRHGVPVLDLDLNASGAAWNVERHPVTGRWALRPSLSDVGSLTDADRDRLLTGRPYSDLRDLTARTRLPRETLDDLALVGALDALADPGPGAGGRTAARDRRDVLVRARALARARPGPSASPGQLRLDSDAPVPAGAGSLPPMTHAERVTEEMRVLGYELSGHVLDPYVDRLADLEARHGLVTAHQLHRVPDGARVTVAGVRVSVQTPPTRSGRRVVFTSVEDRSGITEVALFSDAQESSAAVVLGSRLLVVEGRVRRAAPGALPTVTATRVRPLDQD
ncbi:PHP domain-containing protein [Nocardiopsis ganjiahuensis]|uniref:PHP domain-containing protein n=1 Tax=Nocardiopsis ganjiahuensis TaxID=239984 RepID=UPI000347FF85|nr:PHP domain-containing protein [Nocardiopsis ganjiahuensis]